MKGKQTLMLRKAFHMAVSVVILGASMNTNAGLFGIGGDTWKEEALQPDGSKIVVERSVARKGRHEIGQMPSIGNQSLTFAMPGTGERVKWEDTYSEDVGGGNFSPMLLGVLQNKAYVLASPTGCLSYNKWGRPNPPYVVFRYEGKEWKRIALADLPAEFKLPNLIISSPDDEVEKSGTCFITAEMVGRIDQGFGRPEYKSILREVDGDAADVLRFADIPGTRATAAGAVDRIEFDPLPGSGEAASVMTWAELMARGFVVQGSAGDDLLTGTAADERLLGGEGDDVLSGGAGNDTYRVPQSATDRDTITDDDGKGLIKDASGRIVAGAFVAREGGGYALVGNPLVTAVKEAADLAITLQGGAQIVLANFTNAPGGELGVHLFDAPTAPGTTEFFGYGSRRWRDGDSAVPANSDPEWRRAA